jgi:hypothetical protein
LEEFLGQRDDDARRPSHVAESIPVLVLGHLADEFGAVGAQASDSVVDAFDCKHDAPEAQCVRRSDRRFDLDQFWIAKLRQLKPPVAIWVWPDQTVQGAAASPRTAGHRTNAVREIPSFVR